MMTHARPHPPARPDRAAHLLRAVEARGRVRWRASLARYEPVTGEGEGEADVDARADAETVAALATWLRRRCPCP